MHAGRDRTPELSSGEGMSSIIFDIANEDKLTVQEYVRFAEIKEKVEKLLDDAKIKQALCEYEKYIRDLSIDVIIRFNIEKKS